jgi:hypothetical protein
MVKRLTDDKECLELMMTNLVSQVNNLKEEVKYREHCDIYGNNLESRMELRRHMINENSTNQGTQTNSFKSDTAPMQAVEDVRFYFVTIVEKLSYLQMI